MSTCTSNNKPERLFREHQHPTLGMRKHVCIHTAALCILREGTHLDTAVDKKLLNSSLSKHLFEEVQQQKPSPNNFEMLS